MGCRDRGRLQLCGRRRLLLLGAGPGHRSAQPALPPTDARAAQPRPNTHDAMAELIDILKCRVSDGQGEGHGAEQSSGSPNAALQCFRRVEFGRRA